MRQTTDINKGRSNRELTRHAKQSNNNRRRVGDFGQCAMQMQMQLAVEALPAPKMELTQAALRSSISATHTGCFC